MLQVRKGMTSSEMYVVGFVSADIIQTIFFNEGLENQDDQLNMLMQFQLLQRGIPDERRKELKAVLSLKGAQ